MQEVDIAALIRRRRRQILVHSCLYYRMNESIVADYVYDGWARELAQLHEQYPDIAATVEFADIFENFTGETVSGFDLPTHLPEIYDVASHILRIHKKYVATKKF